MYLYPQRNMTGHRIKGLNFLVLTSSTVYIIIFRPFAYFQQKNYTVYLKMSLMLKACKAESHARKHNSNTRLS